jgi:hypothetical protein
MKPEVVKLLQERDENIQADDQFTHCLPEGPRFSHFVGLPKKVVQTPSLIIVLSEDLSFRQIFLDGRPLPTDPSPSFMGFSVGRWDGDALVVESIGYKARTWLDFAGSPHGEKLRVTERWRRLNFGQMEVEETFTDPEYYSRPLNVKVAGTLVSDTDLLEFVCAENERIARNSLDERLRFESSSRPSRLIRQSDAIRRQLRFPIPENPSIPSTWHVTMTDGTLFLSGAR